ncbi:putative BSD domain-containing protein [Medicago truncatula]|uniref:BSD domain protein n=1 Tax=Medicago truncatula TaxID=3880 RepID=A0A072VCG3_MEDTR|nr:uncharacterized protein LOC25489981 [Medicago truncatula]KEH35835.1 BSD domain protein [Medicago truncatula]RHN70389.1 putative BSD domain-containing protein [Medicago truncatula]
MSSWFARSLANSLRLDDDDDGDIQNDIVTESPTTSPRNNDYQQQQDNNAIESEEENDETLQGRGVKEDLDEIKQTLTRQFWGMASFLAPPPSSTISQDEHEQQRQVDDDIISNQNSEMEQGVFRRDDPEPNSNTFGSDSEGEHEREFDIQCAVGITEEVLTFAMNIAMHPETWLDFPIDEEDDNDDFEMSEDQRDHAMVVERLAPRLAALRIELCPCHMSESYFWKVYFVLLHSRLNKQDSEVLSTPQVMVARSMWMQELQKQTKPEFEIFGRSDLYSRDNAQHHDSTPSLSDDTYSDDMPHRTYGYRTTSLSMMADNESEKYTIESSGSHLSDKSVIEENPSNKTENKDLKSGRASQIMIQDYDDDDDDWPDDDSDLGGYSGTPLPIVNEEDISFSDLEDDDYGIKHVSSNSDSKVV